MNNPHLLQKVLSSCYPFNLIPYVCREFYNWIELLQERHPLLKGNLHALPLHGVQCTQLNDIKDCTVLVMHMNETEHKFAL